MEDCRHQEDCREPHDGALNPRCTVLRLRPQLPSSVAPQAQLHPGGSSYVPSVVHGATNHMKYIQIANMYYFKESTCQGVGSLLRTAVTGKVAILRNYFTRGFDLRPDARTTAASAVPSACVPRRMARLLIDFLVEGTLDGVDDGVAEVVGGREQVDARDVFEHEVPALEALE